MVLKENFIFFSNKSNVFVDDRFSFCAKNIFFYVYEIANLQVSNTNVGIDLR